MRSIVLYCTGFCFRSQNEIFCTVLHCVFVSEAKMRSFVLYCTGFCFRSQCVMFCIALHCVLFQKPRYDLRDSHHDSRGHAGSLSLHPTEIRL